MLSCCTYKHAVQVCALLGVPLAYASLICDWNWPGRGGDPWCCPRWGGAQCSCRRWWWSRPWCRQDCHVYIVTGCQSTWFPLRFFFLNTICPGSSDPFFIVSYYIRWVNTSWTHSTFLSQSQPRFKYFTDLKSWIQNLSLVWTLQILISTRIHLSAQKGIRIRITINKSTTFISIFIIASEISTQDKPFADQVKNTNT